MSGPFDMAKSQYFVPLVVMPLVSAFNKRDSLYWTPDVSRQ